MGKRNTIHGQGHISPHDIAFARDANGSNNLQCRVLCDKRGGGTGIEMPWRHDTVNVIFMMNRANELDRNF